MKSMICCFFDLRHHSQKILLLGLMCYLFTLFMKPTLTSALLQQWYQALAGHIWPCKAAAHLDKL